MSKELEIELEIGDRVDHKFFGLGTVSDVSGSSISFIPPLNSNGPVCRVSVEWDAPEQPGNTVMSWALKKMSSPHQRPFAYWEKKWAPLHKEWLEARKNTERACSSFTLSPDSEKLHAAMLREKLAFEALEAFWEEAQESERR